MPIPGHLRPQLDAFLADAKDRPDDPAVRLILADWLDDHGDPIRAEWLRVQARSQEEPDPASESRARELLHLHAAKWLGPLHSLADTWSVRSGFWHLNLPGQSLTSAAPDVFESESWAWVHSLRPTMRGEDPEALARCPGLRTITRLSFDSAGLGDAGVVALLLRSPYLQSLRDLDLGLNYLSAKSLDTLICAPCLPALRRLDLTGNPFNSASLGPLLRSPAVSGLEDLILDAVPVNAAGIAALTTSRHLTRLQRLDLSHTVLEDSSIPRLANWPGLDRLVSLKLNSNALTDPQLAPLLEWLGDSSPRLEQLQLEWNSLGAPTAELLAGPGFARLRTLVLNNNPLGPDGAHALGASPHLTGLRRVELRHTVLTDEGGIALACSPFVRGVVDLDLDDCALGEGTLQAFVESAPLPRLRRLNLRGNRLAFSWRDRLRQAFPFAEINL
jgi:uncharacterized protein (TIGR02996 family)